MGLISCQINDRKDFSSSNRKQEEISRRLYGVDQPVIEMMTEGLASAKPRKHLWTTDRSRLLFVRESLECDVLRRVKEPASIKKQNESQNSYVETNSHTPLNFELGLRIGGQILKQFCTTCRQYPNN